MSELELTPRTGWVGPELAAELPGLEVLQVAVAGGRRRRSPVEVHQRLWAMSSRFTGARAVSLRRQPVAAAYRACFRQIGLDPDQTRTPIEAAVLKRMRDGRFKSEGLPDDALLVALLETSVAMFALDAARVQGDVGLRLAGARERLGDEEAGPVLDPGQVVLADSTRPLGTLFAELEETAMVSDETETTLLLAVRVRGVPSVIAEEALWIASDTLRANV